MISRAIELVWSVLVASRNGRPRLRLSMMLHPDVALQKDFWKYSLPVLGNELVWGCGFTMYTVIMVILVRMRWRPIPLRISSRICWSV